MMNKKKAIAIIGAVSMAFFVFFAMGAFGFVWWTGTPDFVINETSHFVAGTRSDSGGNYELETFTDNLRIREDTLQFSNAYSDRFTFPDADANTTKWTTMIFDINGDGTKVVDIDTTSPDKLHMNITMGTSGFIDVMVVQNVKVWGDFDIETNYSDYYVNGFDTYCFFGMFTTNDVQTYNMYGMGRTTENVGKDEYYTEYASRTQTVTTDTSGRIRMTRTTVGDVTTLVYYYWDYGIGDWVEQVNVPYDNTVTTDVDDNNYIGYLCEPTSNTIEFSGDFSEFKVNSGGLMADISDVYTSTGQWASDAQTIQAGRHLENVTLNMTNLDPNHYLDYFMIVNASNSIRYFNDTDIVSDGLITYHNITVGGDAYDWEWINSTEDFYISLSFNGDGTDTPILEDIIGYYNGTAAPTSMTVTVHSPTNTTYMSSAVWFNVSTSIPATSCQYSLNGGSNVTMINTAGNNWDKYGWTYSPTCSHNVTFYCTDGSASGSSTMYFSACGNRPLEAKRVLW